MESPGITLQLADAVFKEALQVSGQAGGALVMSWMNAGFRIGGAKRR